MTYFLTKWHKCVLRCGRSAVLWQRCMDIVVSCGTVISLAVEEKTKLKESNYLIRRLTHEDSLHTGPQQALLAKLWLDAKTEYLL